MAKVLVTEGSLSAIGSAIRNKLGVATTYKPGEMAAAIGQIHGEPALQQKTVTVNGDVTPDNGYDGLSKVTVAVPPPTLVSKSITVNGTYPAANENADGFSSVSVNVPNTYAASDEGKVVQNGALVAQTSRAVTANGTYDTTVNNRVVVNVAGSGGGNNEGIVIPDSAWEFAEYVNKGITLTKDSTTGDVSVGGIEYAGNVSSNTAMIEDLNLTLLGDFSTGGAASGNTLSASIANYTAVILQGIYRGSKTSGYNTSMLYVSPKLNSAYWAGMKDRNNSYDCDVTFTDDTTCSLSGNRQVVIYGMP